MNSYRTHNPRHNILSLHGSVSFHKILSIIRTNVITYRDSLKLSTVDHGEVETGFTGSLDFTRQYHVVLVGNDTAQLAPDCQADE
jgi:hypothetical protein